ncbi:transglutaminase TgpA family protein [Streptomyces albipurpureus]|uniref:DUF3488 and transglutaminase-like domain-containing protein n=1 Tax=Streptomyces albipurpureus TaxID=2897419 RepID=A0ABT0UVJ2_9ACTN|nr:DUF3488 and transglutaminase-like domain-containing protein [Streptomyces sp. CWNU-1]MCM2392417.1 DUF3488 and transglutaminase-like domain-containing protein [Streptomyces sp. CWNU-1]
MSGRGRLALCAYAATLMTAAALLPLLDSPGWLVQAAVLLAIQSGVGAAARRVPLARPLTVVLQLLVALVLLTLAFAREQAVLGVIPGPTTFTWLGDLLAAGGQDIGQFATPAPATDGIRLMVIGGVLLIGLLVDVVAVTFRSAAPAGLPLLAMYSVAAGLSGGGANWLWFLLAASGYLLLLLTEGRDRLSQWGRVFRGAPAKPPRGARAFEPDDGAPQAPVRTGRRIGALALGVALVVPAALPALDGGLLAGVGATDGSGSEGGGTITAVNPLVSLQDNLNQSDNREVMRYRTSAQSTDDLYLRFVALDRFDGTTWKSSERKVKDVPDRLPQPPGLSAAVKTTEVRTNISAAGYYEQNWLPLPYPATEVSIDGRWRFEPEGRTVVGDRGEDTRDARYSVSSLLVEPTAAQLADAPPAPPKLRREYTKVPDTLPAVVKETAERVTKNAANDHERAVMLQDWFATSGGFTYDTQVQSGTGVNAITRFLREKQGFCIHFSFSMAAMARTLGIPARVAVGFTPGAPGTDGTVSVTVKDAHAWPELYFEGVGWTRFEPTPSRGNVPGYAQPEAPAGSPSSPAQPEATASDEPSVTPSTSDSCTTELRRLGECGAGTPQDLATPTDSGTSAGTVVLTGLTVLAAVAVPLLPMLWRLRTRLRRLGSGGRTETAARARTLGAWLEVSDTAWDYGIPPQESQTPRKAAARIVELGKLEGDAASAVQRIASAVEQVLYAPRPYPVAGLAEDAERVRAGLRAGVGRATRLRALLLPRSTVRVMWAASARWLDLTDRWRASRWSPAGWPTLLRRPSRERG